MNKIKARAVEPALGAFTCWLVVVMSAGLLQVACSDCDDELFLKLDKITTYEPVEEILKRLPDTMRICEATVGQYLGFRDTACELEGLTEDHFEIPGGLKCCIDPDFIHPYYKEYKSNRGLKTFVDHYKSERRKSCADKLVPHYEQAVAQLSEENKLNIERVIAPEPEVEQRIVIFGAQFSGLADYGHKFSDRYERFANREKDLSSCIALIETFENSLPKVRVKTLAWHDDYTHEWSNKEDTCIRYVKCLCSKNLDKEMVDANCYISRAPSRFVLIPSEKALCKRAEQFVRL